MLSIRHIPAVLLVALVPTAALANATPPLFRTNALFGVGTNPMCVATGDFDRDGNTDLVTADTGTDSISILLGTGNGAFRPRVGYHTANVSSGGRGPTWVAVADLNLDGNPDLLTADEAGTFTVLLGNGDGSFVTGTSYAVGSSGCPTSIATGDFNGDGIPDVVVVDGCSFSLSVFLGDGDGHFHGRTDYMTGNEPGGVVVADLNGDGFLDLATANNSGFSVSVLLGRGDGTFAPRTDWPLGFGNGAMAITVADVDRNGTPDLLVAGNAGLCVMLGPGDGRFPTSASYYAGTGTAIAVGDVDGDGNLDAVVTEAWESTLSVLQGNGHGSFAQAVAYPTSGQAFSVALADFNHDGRLDVAACRRAPYPGVDNGAVSVYFNVGNGLMARRGEFNLGRDHRDPTIADVDRDGHADVLAADYSDNLILVVHGNGDGTLGTVAQYPAGSNPTALAVADLDGDAAPDIVMANAASAGVLLNNGNGTFRTGASYDTGTSPWSVALGDLNGDHRVDLVIANLSSSSLTVRLGNGDGTFGPRSDVATDPTPYQVVLSDLNGDGHLDAVVCTQGTGGASVFLGNGDGTFANRINYAPGAVAVTVADLNEDGHPDLVLANQLRKTVFILLGHGDGTFAAPVEYATEDWAGTVATGDFDGDGHTDVAASNGYTSSISILFGRGDGTFGPRSDYGSVEFGQVVVADLNGDGKPDLVSTSINGSWNSPLCLLLNQASSTTVNATPLGRGGNALDLAAFPNPSRGELTVSFSITNTDPVQFEVFDVHGRRVLSRSLSGFAPGRHALDLSNDVRLASGVYAIKLTQGARSIMGRAVVLR